MKILHIVKQAPDASTRKIIEVHTATGNQVKTIELYKGGIDYDAIVKDVFSHDKIFCW